MSTTSTSFLGRQLQESQVLAEARRLLDAGDAVAALAGCEQLSRGTANQVPALTIAGEAHAMLGQLPKARAALTKAIKMQPHDPALHCTLATTYHAEGRFAEARQCFDAALKLRPGEPVIVSAKAKSYLASGDFDAAHSTLQPLLAQGIRHLNVALAFAQLCQKLKREHEGIAMLREGLSQDQGPASTRTEVLFHLGHLHDRLGEYNQAFEAYREANRLRGARFDPASFSLAVDELIHMWSAARLSNLPRSSVTTGQLVFIVGMPRSGTTLVEQVLASHPGVYGAGERDDVAWKVHEWQGAVGGGVSLLTNIDALTFDAVDRAAREYLDRLVRLAPKARRITDKMPLNCLHLGLISLMFPLTRVIHCVRDPLDTCLSCFMQNFSGAYPFAYNLEHLGSFYRDYQRLMRHWHQVLNLPILDVAYEQMVMNHEAMSRKLVAFVGLEWSAACLKFHENTRTVLTASQQQVRRPIYDSSLQRYKHYEKHLGPLQAALDGRTET